MSDDVATTDPRTRANLTEDVQVNQATNARSYVEAVSGPAPQKGSLPASTTADNGHAHYSSRRQLLLSI